MSHFTLFLMIATLAISGYSHANDSVAMPANFEVQAAAMDRFGKNWTDASELDTEVEIRHRDRENCGSKTRMDKPYIIKVKDTTKRVVQTKLFEQIIKITECYEQERPCFDKIKSMSNQIKTKCVQNYAYITLYVYGENNEIKPERFPIPVSCSCRIQYQDIDEDFDTNSI